MAVSEKQGLLQPPRQDPVAACVRGSRACGWSLGRASGTSCEVGWGVSSLPHTVLRVCLPEQEQLVGRRARLWAEQVCRQKTRIQFWIH